MLPSLLSLLLASTALAQQPAGPISMAPPIPPQTDIKPPPPPATRNYVALVVGLATYDKLPKEVHLDFARSDAATVAQSLREQGRFDQVFLLRDSEATKEAIRETLRTKVAQFVGPNDVFVLYFVGHGVGADLGTPVLLAYDSTVANGQEDGLELQAFARDLQTFAPSGMSVMVTDVVHRNQLDGIYFYGPAAEQWPSMPRGVMLLSSSGPSEAAKDGAFAQAFSNAMSGGADADGDHLVTNLELYTYLEKSFQGTGQTPHAAGNFDWHGVAAQDVAGGSVAYVSEGNKPPPEASYPDIEVSAAKFVWGEGASQSVQCRDEPIVACAPSCYVRTFKAGPCELSAVMDGVQMKSRLVVVAPGKYDCNRKGGDLTCSGPTQ
jgi:hypothetical protein